MKTSPVSRLPALVLGSVSLAFAGSPPDVIHAPYLLDQGLISRSISFENPP